MYRPPGGQGKPNMLSAYANQGGTQTPPIYPGGGQTRPPQRPQKMDPMERRKRFNMSRQGPYQPSTSSTPISVGGPEGLWQGLFGNPGGPPIMAPQDDIFGGKGGGAMMPGSQAERPMDPFGGGKAAY